MSYLNVLIFIYGCHHQVNIVKVSITYKYIYTIYTLTRFTFVLIYIFVQIRDILFNKIAPMYIWIVKQDVVDLVWLWRTRVLIKQIHK